MRQRTSLAPWKGLPGTPCWQWHVSSPLTARRNRGCLSVSCSKDVVTTASGITVANDWEQAFAWISHTVHGAQEPWLPTCIDSAYGQEEGPQELGFALPGASARASQYHRSQFCHRQLLHYGAVATDAFPPEASARSRLRSDCLGIVILCLFPVGQEASQIRSLQTSCSLHVEKRVDGVRRSVRHPKSPAAKLGYPVDSSNLLFFFPLHFTYS